MPKILTTEICVKSLLESDENFRTGLKCYYAHVDGCGGAYENIKQA